MSYYESAEGIEISLKRALVELDRHGIIGSDRDDFLARFGNRSTMPAQAVLDWLGY